jgi:hypothetical protein
MLTVGAPPDVVLSLTAQALSTNVPSGPVPIMPLASRCPRS